MKKLFALLLALVMVMSMATTAFAAGEGEEPEIGPAAPSYTITINNATAGHTYEAYQIFAGDLAEKINEDGTSTNRVVLSNITWGDGITDSVALLAKIKEDEKLATAFASATDAATVAKCLGDNANNATIVTQFATVVGNKLNADNAVESEYSETNKNYTITGLKAGYYLVKDKNGSLNGQYDAYTNYILHVVKDVEVAPKSDVPEVNKTINDTDGDDYGEHEDFDITDIAYYKWVGTLPTNLLDYDQYSYTFVDTLPKGIDFIAIQQVYIQDNDGNKVETLYDVSDAEHNEYPDGLTETFAGHKVTMQPNDSYAHSDVTVEGVTVPASASGVLKLSIANLFDQYPNIRPTHSIVVKYTALVANDVKYNEAMTNKVHIEYSNDPNGGGKGVSTPDEAHAYTFDLNIKKVDADNESIPLEGAEFKLYYTRTSGTTITNYYALVVTEEMIKAGTTVNGVTLTTEKHLGHIYGWTTDETEASILDTDANGDLKISGLDADTYYLKETKAPAGYNLMTDPVRVTITPTYSENGKAVSIKYTVKSAEQTNNTVIITNAAGSTLPSTGGMGTTIFYVLGSVMVLGAVLLLVTKKRMAAEN